MRKLLALLLIASLCLPSQAGVLFTAADSDFLNGDEPVGFDEPTTISVQFTVADATPVGVVFSFEMLSPLFTDFIIGFTFTELFLGRITGADLAAASETAANSVLDGIWHSVIHQSDVPSNLDSRSSIDGTADPTPGTGVTAFDHTLIQRTLVGAFDAGGGSRDFLDGTIANLVVHTLGDDARFRASMHAGAFPPYAPHPELLIAYWPLQGNATTEVDIVGGVVLTVGSGSPIHAGHKPIMSMPGMQ